MIEAIFYARFDHEQGPIVLHQSPSYSITPAPAPPLVVDDDSPFAAATPPPKPIFDFNAVSSYVIPSQEFCDRLISVVTNGYRVLGHPVCITDERYPRNEFIFNFVLVINEHEEFEKYERLVRKLAALGREVETRGLWLSKDEEEQDEDAAENEIELSMTQSNTLDTVDSHDSSTSAPTSKSDASSNDYEQDSDGLRLSDIIAATASHKAEHGLQIASARERSSRVSALCEMLMEDLNSYGECLIPIDASTTLNTKLFPTLRPPPPIKPEHVPLPTIHPLTSLADSNWDLTLLRTLPFIDGVNSISQIATLASADLRLVRAAIAHLAFYGAVVLTDVFHFGAVYVPTRALRRVLLDTALLDECVRFARQGPSGDVQEGREVSEEERERVAGLYAALKHGVALRTWVASHAAELSKGGIDVRRFVTVGLVKGLVARVHRYPVLVSKPVKGAKWDQVVGTGGADGIMTMGVSGTVKKKAKKEATAQTRDLRFAGYLDGTHSLDRICTDLQIPERKALEELKKWDDVQILHR